MSNLVISMTFAGAIADQSRGRETPFIARFVARTIGVMEPTVDLTDHDAADLHLDLQRIDTPRAKELAKQLSDMYYVKHYGETF